MRLTESDVDRRIYDFINRNSSPTDVNKEFSLPVRYIEYTPGYGKVKSFIDAYEKAGGSGILSECAKGTDTPIEDNRVLGRFPTDGGIGIGTKKTKKLVTTSDRLEGDVLFRLDGRRVSDFRLKIDLLDLGEGEAGQEAINRIFGGWLFPNELDLKAIGYEPNAKPYGEQTGFVAESFVAEEIRPCTYEIHTRHFAKPRKS